MANQRIVPESSRTEQVGHTGIYPASGPLPDGDAPVRGQGALAHPEERALLLAEQESTTRAESWPLAAGRVLFGGFFLFNGINHFLKRKMLVQYASTKGVPNPDVAVVGSGLLLVAGGLSLVTGTQPKFGAALVATFLVGVTPAMHAFWSVEDESTRMNEFVNFTKNIALIGGAAFAAVVPSPWPGRLQLPAPHLSQALVPLTKSGMSWKSGTTTVS
jgi:putative oxidoreductase